MQSCGRRIQLILSFVKFMFLCVIFKKCGCLVKRGKVELAWQGKMTSIKQCSKLGRSLVEKLVIVTIK